MNILKTIKRRTKSKEKTYFYLDGQNIQIISYNEQNNILHYISNDKTNSMNLQNYSGQRNTLITQNNNTTQKKHNIYLKTIHRDGFAKLVTGYCRNNDFVLNSLTDIILEYIAKYELCILKNFSILINKYYIINANKNNLNSKINNLIKHYIVGNILDYPLYFFNNSISEPRLNTYLNLMKLCLELKFIECLSVKVKKSQYIFNQFKTVIDHLTYDNTMNILQSKCVYAKLKKNKFKKINFSELNSIQITSIQYELKRLLSLFNSKLDRSLLPDIILLLKKQLKRKSIDNIKIFYSTNPSSEQINVAKISELTTLFSVLDKNKYVIKTTTKLIDPRYIKKIEI